MFSLTGNYNVLRGHVKVDIEPQSSMGVLESVVYYDHYQRRTYHMRFGNKRTYRKEGDVYELKKNE